MIIRLLRHAAAWLPCFVLFASVMVALTSNSFGSIIDPACGAAPFNNCAQTIPHDCTEDTDARTVTQNCVDCDGDGVFHTITGILETYTCLSGGGESTAIAQCRQKTITTSSQPCEP